MHACPDCGMACDCDGEDTWMDGNALECIHECDEEDDSGWYFDEDDGSWIFDDEVTWYAPHNITLSDRRY